MKVVIFDMYGVIMKAPEGDLIPYVHRNFPGLAEDHINTVWKEAAYGRISSEEFFRILGYRNNVQDIEKEYLDTIEIDEEFLRIANYMKDKSKLVLLSNDIKEWNYYLRDKFCLNEIFHQIVISGDHGTIKPDIKLFQMILEYNRVQASDCIYIDDREKNLIAAEQLGIKTILFNRRKVTYQGSIVDSFQELRLILSSLL